MIPASPSFFFLLPSFFFLFFSFSFLSVLVAFLPNHLSSSGFSSGGVGSAAASGDTGAYVLLLIPLCKRFCKGGSAWLGLGHKPRLIGSRQPGPRGDEKRGEEGSGLTALGEGMARPDLVLLIPIKEEEEEEVWVQGEGRQRHRCSG